jgi:hypothetical protein
MQLIYSIEIPVTSKAYKPFEDWHDIIMSGVNLTDNCLGIYRDYADCDKVSFTVAINADISKQRSEIRGRYLREFYDRFGHFTDIRISVVVTD